MNNHHHCLINEVGLVPAPVNGTVATTFLEEELVKRNEELEESRVECLKLKEELEKIKQRLEQQLRSSPTAAIPLKEDSKPQQIRCKGYLGGALLKALETRSAARIIELLNRRADINYRDSNGVPALSYAVMFGCPPAVVKQMLDHGADVNVVDNYGMTPLFRAIENDEEPITRLFIDYGAAINYGGLHCNKTSLMLAAERGQTNFVKLLLGSGANVDLESNHGWTALIYAVQSNHLEAAELLVDGGANVNAQTSTAQSYHGINSPMKGLHTPKDTTPLMIAVERNNLDFVLLLLSSGADVSGVNSDGNTPLSLAAKDDIKLALREAMQSSGSS